ncbi:MAG: large repetitive protein [Verrucomicrobiota bacterium]|jgi:hypothetical protein
MATKRSVRKKAAPKKSKAQRTSGKTTGKKSAAKKKPARKTAAKSVRSGGTKRLLASRSTLTFLTESLPAFMVGRAKKARIQGVGGTKPYSFGISQGTLPAGLHLNYRGTLYGTPTVAGDTTIFVKLIDFVGSHITQAFDLQVMDA